MPKTFVVTFNMEPEPDAPGTPSVYTCEENKIVDISSEDEKVYEFDGQTNIESFLREKVYSRHVHSESEFMREGSSIPIPIIEKSHVSPGEYFMRMYRPILEHSNFMHSAIPKVDEHLLAKASLQISALIDSLTRISKTVFPESSNLGTYGDEIRNLIILACTEVEAQWKGILSANNKDTSNKDSRTTTNDYVKLAKPLKLSDYEIKLDLFPWLPSFSPFANWSSNEPTQSLCWYSAYNAVKHNREGEFHKAKFKFALEAVVACYIMLIAQFGHHKKLNHLRQFFQVVNEPKWLVTEKYIPTRNSTWKAVPYQF